MNINIPPAVTTGSMQTAGSSEPIASISQGSGVLPTVSLSRVRAVEPAASALQGSEMVTPPIGAGESDFVDVRAGKQRVRKRKAEPMEQDTEAAAKKVKVSQKRFSPHADGRNVLFINSEALQKTAVVSYLKSQKNNLKGQFTEKHNRQKPVSSDQLVEWSKLIKMKVGDVDEFVRLVIKASTPEEWSEKFDELMEFVVIVDEARQEVKKRDELLEKGVVGLML